MYKENYDAVATNPDLKIPVLGIMVKGNNQEEIKKLLHNDPDIENLLLKREPFLYMKIMTILGKDAIAENKLIGELHRIISESSPKELYELGKLFYRLGKSRIFKAEIPDDFPDKQKILRDLARHY